MKMKIDNKVGIFAIFGLIALIVITGCVDNGKTMYINTSVNMTPVSQSTPGKEVITTSIPKGTSDIGARTSGIMERYSLDKLVSLSDNIVIAEVVDVLPSRWNTQSGEKPTVSNGISQTIYTDTNLKIVEYLKGSLYNIGDNSTITVRTIGGTVGQDKQIEEDQSSYNIGEKVMIFLKNDSDPRTKDVGCSHFMTVGSMQGKISIPAGNELIIGDVKISLEEAKVIIAGKGGKSYGTI